MNVNVPVYVPPTSVLVNGLPFDGSAGAVVLPVQIPTYTLSQEPLGIVDNCPAVPVKSINLFFPRDDNVSTVEVPDNASVTNVAVVLVPKPLVATALGLVPSTYVTATIGDPAPPVVPISME